MTITLEITLNDTAEASIEELRTQQLDLQTGEPINATIGEEICYGVRHIIADTISEFSNISLADAREAVQCELINPVQPS